MLIAMLLAQVAPTDPGLKPADYRVQILTDQRQTLRDPYSMIDLHMCEPRPGPGWWTVLISLKSKNGYGGYGDAQGYAYQFIDGKRKMSIEMGPDEANDCPLVAKAEIAKVFQ